VSGRGFYPCAKRTTDIVAAATGLVVLLPLLAAVAALVLVTMGWPVFFVQERPGLRGRPFRLVKFRTMRTGPGTDSGRLTRLGRLLRRLSLDELPELWNVVRGEMSLVGPRPLLMEYLPYYSPEQARRHDVRPGITGWAQVNGRNALTWEQKFAHDVWYVDHRSAGLDLRILGRTIRRVVSREGVDFPGGDQMPFFRGTGAPGEGKEDAGDD
jgi:sugar transferase EpsL